MSEHWPEGSAPVAVVMISLNEGHNMDAVLRNLSGWAQQVFLVDSYSEDNTVDVALRHGVHVIQRPFRGFGDQWNFALATLPISAEWTMKLDPDERLSEELKASIGLVAHQTQCNGIRVTRRWWFMGRPLPIREQILRVWRTGACRFSDVSVNEHPLVAGPLQDVSGDLEHLDSPDLTHWFDKQNRYSTAEAIASSTGSQMAAEPRLFGSSLQRRMWMKRNLRRLPGHPLVLFLYYWLWKGTWRAGRVGYIAARLWSDVWRFRDYKRYEIALNGRISSAPRHRHRRPDARVAQWD